MDDREMDNSALRTLLRLIRKKRGTAMMEKRKAKPTEESKEMAVAELVAAKKGQDDGASG